MSALPNKKTMKLYDVPFSQTFYKDRPIEEEEEEEEDDDDEEEQFRQLIM